MKKALLKDSIKEIKVSFKRFISILLMSLLGVGFFAGIKATSPDMRDTLDLYFDNSNVYDLQVISTLGITDSDINYIKDIDEINDVIGTYSKDVVINLGETSCVSKVIALNSDINKVTLLEGNLPENNNECVVENNFIKSTDKSIRRLYFYRRRFGR